ncbi:MAG: MotA/TolQ/ExbB proton channel family protein [Puniceicoccaceae bacterium]
MRFPPFPISIRVGFAILAFLFAGALSTALNAQENSDASPQGANTADGVALESEEAGTIDWGAEVLKGGTVAFVLIGVAVAGLAFFLERLYTVRKAKFVSGKKAEAILKPWRRADVESAQRAARRDKTIFGRVAEYISTHTHLSFEIVSFGASDMVSRAVGRQLQRTYPLAIVATVSPLLGLLGTIIGMIEAFQKVAIMGDTGDASVLADSIGKALITTAIGLIVAIPALSAYHYFKMKINNLGIRIEEEMDEMLALWLMPEPEVAEEPESETSPAESAPEASQG